LTGDRQGDAGVVIESLAEAIAALVAALVELIALPGEMIVWVVLALVELVVALVARRAWVRPRLRRWWETKGT